MTNEKTPTLEDRFRRDVIDGKIREGTPIEFITKNNPGWSSKVQAISNNLLLLDEIKFSLGFPEEKGPGVKRVIGYYFDELYPSIDKGYVYIGAVEMNSNSERRAIILIPLSYIKEYRIL